MTCKMCNLSEIEHKRKHMCTSCYKSYRKETWIINDKVRKEDKVYLKNHLLKKRLRHIPMSYVNKTCSQCSTLVLKGSKKGLCSSCVKVANLKRKITYQLLRKKTHLPTRVRENLKSRIHRSLFKGKKDHSIVYFLGCSISELKIHLEAKFQPSMTWNNYGFYGWHIDHIKPLSAFNPEQLKEAYHYTNLQPLWAKDNFTKGDKYDL